MSSFQWIYLIWLAAALLVAIVSLRGRRVRAMQLVRIAGVWVAIVLIVLLAVTLWQRISGHEQPQRTPDTLAPQSPGGDSGSGGSGPAAAPDTT